MYRRILVPVDGSATSKLGLRHALGLAKDQHARIRVMNVLDDLALAPMLDGYPVDITMLIDSMKASGDKALDEAIRLAQKAGVNAERAMVEGRGHLVSDTILADAKKFRADVIVMVRRPARLEPPADGRDAERVLRESHVPVLLISARNANHRRVKA